MPSRRRITVGDIAETIAMGPFGSNIKVETFQSDGVPVISGAHLHGVRLNDGAFNFVSIEHANRLGRSNVRRGDVVFTHAGNIGQVAYIPENSKFDRYVISQRQFYLRCNNDADPRYIAYYFRSPMGQHALLANASQVGVPSIARPATYLRSIELLLPSMPEQIAIAETLSTLDDKIELNRRMNETLEAMARAIFKDWFVEFGPTRAKMEGRAPYLAPEAWSLFPDHLDDEGKPDGWGEKRVEDILELAYGKALKASDRTDGPIPVYGSGGITGYHNEALVEGPSVIVGRKGTVGVLYWEDRPFFPIDTVFYVRPKVHLTFCYYHLQTLGLETMNTDAAVPGLNRNNVYRLSVPWSDDELRMQFDQLAAPLRQRIRANSEEIETLSTTRDFLLPKLMSGEVRVKDAEKIVGEAT